MADNSYSVEVKICSKNGWQTPAEAKRYYGRYSRAGITWHWWGDNTGASNHNNIVNYISNKATRGTGSVNYVLSDAKITLMVNPDNVAWCSQAGNPTTVSVELQPTLSPEGYKKAGWLANQLEQRYGHPMIFYPHKHWFATACPGSINLGRIQEEANKWKNGSYDSSAPPSKPPVTPAPIPKPPEPAVVLVINNIDPNRRVKLIRDATLWNLQFDDWTEAKAVSTLSMSNTNDVGGFEASAYVVHPLGGRYYISEYSYAKGIPNGINVKDTDQPDPTKIGQPITPPIIVPGPPITQPPPVVEPPIVIPPTEPPVVTPPIVIPPTEPPVDPCEEKNKQQDERLGVIEKFVEKLTNLFSSNEKE